MVNFSVFNELSLPLKDIKEFENFFEVLTLLRNLGLEKIRMDRKFTEYPEILPNLTFQQLIGQVSDRDKKRRLLKPSKLSREYRFSSHKSPPTVSRFANALKSLIFELVLT